MTVVARAFAFSFVEIGFQVLSPRKIIFDFQQVLPFSTKRRGKTICQMKGDELCQPRFVSMGQIAAFTPASIASLRIPAGVTRRPAPFSIDEFPDARVMRRSRRGFFRR